MIGSGHSTRSCKLSLASVLFLSPQALPSRLRSTRSRMLEVRDLTALLLGPLMALSETYSMFPAEGFQTVSHIL